MENEKYIPTDEQREDDNPHYGASEANQRYKNNLKRQQEDKPVPLSERPEWQDLKRKIAQSQTPTRKVIGLPQQFHPTRKLAKKVVADYRTREFINSLDSEERERYRLMSPEEKAEFRKSKSKE